MPKAQCQPERRDKSRKPRAYTANLLTMLLAVGSALLGCADPEQVRARQAAAEAALNDQDDAQCRADGVAPETPAYDECRRNLAQICAENNVIQEQQRRAFDQGTGAKPTSCTLGLNFRLADGT